MIDAHCHYSLIEEPFRSELLEKSFANGLTHCVQAGINSGDWGEQLKLVEAGKRKNWPKIVPAFGIHPWSVNEGTEELLEAEFLKLTEMCSELKSRPSALGEVGLDYVRAKAPIAREKQNIWMSRQVDLAERLNLPVVLHVVRAHQEALSICRKKNYKKVMIHSFTGSASELKNWSDWGATISFAPRSLKNMEGFKDILQEIPIGRLMLESDAPQSPKVPETGSLVLGEIAAILASLMGISRQELLNLTAENAKKFYSL